MNHDGDRFNIFIYYFSSKAFVEFTGPSTIIGPRPNMTDTIMTI